MSTGSTGANGAAPDGALDLAAVFAALPGAAVVYAADAPHFTVLAASDALLGAAQRPRAAVVGRPLAEAFPSASSDGPGASGLETVRASLEAAVRAGAPQRLPRQRYDLQGPNGRWEARYWDAVNVPVRGDDGAVRCVLHQTEDVTAQVRGAAALARAEHHAARVLARIADAYIVLDRDFRFVDMNPAAERVIGKPRAEFLGRTHWEVFPASADADAGRAYRRVAREGTEQHLTQHYVGEGYDVQLEIDAYPTDEGGVAVFWRDVTARVRAEADRARLAAEAAAERERLRVMVLQTPAPLALLEGPEHRFALVNDAYKRVSGGGRDVTGLTPPEAFPELAGTGIHELFDRVYASGEPWVGRETPVRYDRDGTGVIDTWFDLRFEPVRDADGRVTAVFNFCVDVTDQVRARREVERLLAESEAARAEAEAARASAEALGGRSEASETLARQLFALSPLPKWVYDAETLAFLDVNETAVRHYGYTREEFLTMTIRDIRPPEEVPRMLAVVKAPHLTGGSQGVFHHVKKTGEVIEVEVFLRDVQYGGRRASIAVVQDVTERRRSEAALLEATRAAEAARDQAEAASRAKSEFLAVMSHELRTPLNAIGGYAELIELGIRGPVTDQQREDLARIQRSQRALLRLINEVLNYARLETGAVTYDFTEVPVAEAVAAAEVLVAPQFRAKGLGYAWAGADPPGLAVRADHDKLQQILLNLFSNAVKFTNARPGLAGRVEVSCEAAAGAVLIRVRDTGVGVPADKLEAIFEPFVQVNASLTRTQEGTGLGLAISRDLARGMGGDLSAESTLGVGSTVTLTLPRA